MAISDRVTLGLSHLAWGVDLSDERLFTAFLDDAANVGVEGVLIFDATAKAWYARAGEFRGLLQSRGLRLVGAIHRAGLDFEDTRQLARWLRDAGGDVMPITGRTGTEADWSVVVPVLERHGEIAAGQGVMGLYHHNTAAVAPTMALTERLLAETDPRRLVGMVDCGHATKDFPDGSPAEFYRRNHERIKYVEFKDWRPDTDLCTEVGQGRCDWQAVAAALDEHRYQGWIVVEQNGRPDDPREAAARSLAFTRRLIGGA
jgi:sugar phosphate isomerase/epimerase